MVKNSGLDEAKKRGLQGALIGGYFGADWGGKGGLLKAIVEDALEQQQEYNFSTEPNKPRRFRPNLKRSGKVAIKGYLKNAKRIGIPAALLAGLGGAAYGLFEKKGSHMDSKVLTRKLVKLAEWGRTARNSASADKFGSVKQAGLGNGLAGIVKGLVQTGVGVGQAGLGLLGLGAKAAVGGGLGLARYASLLTGARGSAIDREWKALSRAGRPAEELKPIMDKSRSEWNKVLATRLATLAGLGGGGAYVANNSGLE